MKPHDNHKSADKAPSVDHLTAAPLEAGSPQIGAPDFWEQFLSEQMEAERTGPVYERWETDDNRMQQDSYNWRLDTLRIIAKYMGGETFAVRVGRSYNPVDGRRALTDADLVAHAKKHKSIGCYFYKPGSDEVSAAVLDFDDHEGNSTWEDMVEAGKHILAVLAKDQISPSLLVRSRSGNGIHIWLLFDKPRLGKAVRDYLTSVLASCGYRVGNSGVIHKEVELFPKQDSLKVGGLGNLIGLPFAGKGAALDPKTFEVVDTIDVAICDRDLPPPKQDRKTGKTKKARPEETKTRGFEAILSELGDGPGLKGFYEPLHRAVASYVATYWELLDREKLKQLLRKAIDEAPKGPSRTTKQIEDYKSDRKLDSFIDPAIVKYIEKRGVKKELFYAHALSNKYIFAPIGQLWLAEAVDKRIDPIPLLKADGSPVMTGKGSKKKAKKVKASIWLSKHRSVEQMTWAPGYPQIIDDLLVDNGGWVEHPGAHTFNTYRAPPPLVMSEKTPDISMWKDHLHKIYPDAAEHITRWLAFKIQKPGEKINHALVLGGEQGIGKDTLLEPAIRAVGTWNCHEISPQKMLSVNTAFLKSILLRVSEARDLGDVNRYALYERSKTFIATPPDTLMVNEKFIPEYYVANVCGVIFTTNNKLDGLYLAPDDRRHFVAWSSVKKDEFDDQYWRRLWSWYENGGWRAVAIYLHRLDLSDFDPKAPPERTDHFYAIVASGEAPEEREMKALFDAMDNPKAVVIDELAEAAQDADMSGLAEWLGERKNRRQIAHRMLRVGYGLIPSPDTQDKNWRVNKRDVNIYGPMDAPAAERLEWAREYKRIKELEAAGAPKTPKF